MKQVDCLIIAGGSITNSPWFTWADHALFATNTHSKFSNQRMWK